MRLWQLATTQSVTFFAPPEDHQSILDFHTRGEGRHITSHDVVCWLLEQTCQGLENLQPLYYAQGVNYCHRTQAERDHSLFLLDEAERIAYLDALQSHAQLSLKALFESGLEKAKKRVRDAFQDTENAVHASALQDVEQEREVAVEVETIHKRQNPLYFHPQTFSGLATEIRDFALTGALRPDDMTCKRAFSYMAPTETGRKYPADLPETPNLLVSGEFRRAVIVPFGRPNDTFLLSMILQILVSPKEAELLVYLCQGSRKKVVYLLTYAAPITQKMLQFNDLNYYAMSPAPIGSSAQS
ncbi:uncharacterized protein Z519_03860 [Cladophialophora bantiana CBS 173.52]|uniref:Uncharacterized protein n=1 Tax=Cladophialophora bantiana (strain ATCC 10958 / CBS 173.52 / CDC B-1940 / NIH 8579) TaxID=1442370 RepID=A0A0D2EZ83_CLAB1|nr:uncharacterized protein Z519_03860 [Cladophialophora bantiana CBS 173.52]KIW95276.1 hypothetical protein Z519_03860 [Cladophialophora bantiana CBS 173.52]